MDCSKYHPDDPNSPKNRHIPSSLEEALKKGYNFFEHVKENVLYINEEHQLQCPHCKEYNIFPIKIDNYADRDNVYGSRQWFACELCQGISIFQTEFYKGNIYVAMNKAFAFRPSPSVEVS